jgi:hypothetical protein
LEFILKGVRIMARQSLSLNNINPVAAAIGGAILGATAVAAYALSDRDYREKMTKSVSDLHKKTMKRMPSMPEMPNMATMREKVSIKHGISSRRTTKKAATKKATGTGRGRKKK